MQSFSQKADNQSETIGYIVPMGEGLDTFVYRELEVLYGMGFKIELFATKYKKGDVFSPKAEWHTHTLTPRQLLWRSPIILFKALLAPSLLIEAYKDNALIDLVFALDFSSRMKKKGIRQIHCHHGDHKLFIGYFCKRLINVPLSVTIHAHEFFTNPNPDLFRKVIRQCDKVFPISAKWLKLLHEEYGVSSRQLSLNYLFVDTAVYNPDDEITVLSVGRFTERKGFHVLMKAATMLQDIPVRFCFVGFGPLDVERMAREIGIEDRVTVFPKLNQKQLRLLYKNVDILCVPSITTKAEGAEGIPVVLIEGMGCGLPVVATRCGAIEELVESELVAENSAEMLASAIRRLVENPELRKKQGMRNAEKVQKMFSVANVYKFADELKSLGGS
jgi:glycosyltransferase involved in cell wall biosynthesis